MRFVYFALGFGLVASFFVACSSSSDPADGNGGEPAPAGPTPNGSSDGSAGDVGTDPPPQRPNVTLTNQSMQVNGRSRTYILGVPMTYDASRAYPLVMVLHGNPGDADSMSKNLPFDGASKQEAILAYPDGDGNNWDLSTPPASNQDIAFIRVLADEIARSHNIDKGRVFGSGYSGGGFFLNQVACRVPNVFKAFASHSGGAPFNMAGEKYPDTECLPCSAGKVPSIHTHGREDTAVGVKSGYYAAACWAATNTCSEPDPDNWGDVAPPPCKAAPNCTAGKPVALCWVEGLAHAQWSEGAAAAWTFFKSIP